MGLMAAACAAIVIGALLIAVYVVDRVVDGVEQHVEDHTDASSSSAASSPSSGRQLAEIGDPIDVTTELAQGADGRFRRSEAVRPAFSC